MSTSVFVGRQAELDTVSSALTDSLASKPQIVSIEGEPGIGKTSFLRRALPHGDDVVVLDASGDESEIALDYGVVSQLASRAALVSSPLNETIEDPSSRSVFSVGAGLLDMFGALQDSAAVVVAVDDAHLMDPSSAGALLFALRRLHADRVLVLLASRSEELERLGPSWLRLLGDPERAQRVRLGGLTAPDVSLLAGSIGFGTVTLAEAERLREHTGGHPLYVKALLSELPPEALGFDGPLPAPHSYAATVIARLTSVAPGAQDLVAAAAVAGNRCPLTLAGSLAGLSDPLAALEDAIAAELLALVQGRIPEEVTFPHPLVRAAVYDDLSPSRRRRLHLACAELTAGSASLPHRVAASPGSDDALAAELAASANDQEARGDLMTAAEHHLSASRIAASRDARDEALLRGVEHLVQAGEFPRAVGLLDGVLSCAASTRRSYILAILTASIGQVAEGEAALRELTQRQDFADDPELATSVIASLAVVCAVGGRGDEAVKWARRALQRKQASPVAQMVATQGLAWGLSDIGRGQEAIAVYDSVSATRMRPEPFEAELLTARGNIKSWWGDLQGAVEDLSAVIRWSRDGTTLRNLPNAFGALAEAEYRVGRWDDALAHSEVAVSLGEDTDRAWDLPFVHAVASYVHCGRGNWQFAGEHVDAARRTAGPAPAPLSRYYACVAAGHLAWVQEDWNTLLDSLVPLHTPPRPVAMAGLECVPWLFEVEAMIRGGHLEDAGRILRRVQRALDESPQAVTQVDVWRLLGIFEHARRRPAKARAAFLKGQAAAKTAGSPFAEATLELAYGHFLHKTGSRRAAIATLRAARQLFERLDARPFLERCDAELAACGVRPQRNGADDDYGLTAREQVVARLVASGKSNREVAAELYLSSKAIEYHLANIYTKVGISSRHQLASRIHPH